MQEDHELPRLFIILRRGEQDRVLTDLCVQGRRDKPVRAPLQRTDLSQGDKGEFGIAALRQFQRLTDRLRHDQPGLQLGIEPQPVQRLDGGGAVGRGIGVAYGQMRERGLTQFLFTGGVWVVGVHRTS